MAIDEASTFEPASTAYTREYLSLLASCGTDEADRRAAWKVAQASDAYWQGHPSYIGYLPRIYDLAMRARFAGVAETAYGILSKVMDHFRNDVAYRREFSFDPRVEKLILLPQRFNDPLPYARIDFFYNEL